MPSHPRYFAWPAHLSFKLRFINTYKVYCVHHLVQFNPMLALCPQAGRLILFALPKKYAKTLGKIMLLPSCHRTPAILPGLRT